MADASDLTPSWLEATLRRLAGARAAGRLPSALLIHEAPGSGGEWLAGWCARLALCETPRANGYPCGVCMSCRRTAAHQHPDVARISPTEDSRQIRIEQVRELIGDLALTSHGGGYKIGIISPADGLNRFAANALLKTLEEPPPRTLLILVATQPSRLPATILSRCQRIAIPAPPRSAALAFLTAERGPADWNAVLEVLGEAPMLAAQCDPDAVIRIAAEMREGLGQAARAALDPVQTAERWAREELPLRLRCFENYITERIYRAARGSGLLTELRAGTHLPEPAPVLNIRGLFTLLDGVQELYSTLDAPLNRGLALESLLRRLAEEAGADSPGRR